MMASEEMNVRVAYRDKFISVLIKPSATLGEFGEQLQLLTGVTPETMKILLPKSRQSLLLPFSPQHSSQTLQQCGIQEGKNIRLMGALLEEIAEVSQSKEERMIIGFSEEDKRARLRNSPATSGTNLPSGPYTFGEFRTLELQGIELHPPASRALEIMHQLASDRGIVAVMEKHRWHVGLMSEMAPVGYVGVSPTCILGLNKNHGEEISLRLRTDDLKGFRKYEVIKKTLLHELAHMVYGEHDAKFYALDSQLNKEATNLDWTRSKGHMLNGVVKHRSEEANEREKNLGNEKGHILGGNKKDGFISAQAAAGNAALKRFRDPKEH